MLQSATTLQLKKREIGASKKERREVKMKKKKGVKSTGKIQNRCVGRF